MQVGAITVPISALNVQPLRIKCPPVAAYPLHYFLSAVQTNLAIYFVAVSIAKSIGARRYDDSRRSNRR
jgi:hypothetical protein